MSFEEAIPWLRPRGEAGDTAALRVTASMLWRAGRTKEATTIYQQATEAGDAHALKTAAVTLATTGRIEEATTFY